MTTNQTDTAYIKLASKRKTFINNTKELKKYISELVIPIINCVFLDNKYLIFNDLEIYKLIIS